MELLAGVIFIVLFVAIAVAVFQINSSVKELNERVDMLDDHSIEIERYERLSLLIQIEQVSDRRVAEQYLALLNKPKE
jgi:hypothetical protein